MYCGFQWSKSYVATWTGEPVATEHVQKVSVIEILRGHLNAWRPIKLRVMEKVSVIEILRGHLNRYERSFVISSVFQWSKSYVATWTSFNPKHYHPSLWFQWSKSYVATWTTVVIMTVYKKSFSDRNPTWPLEQQWSSCFIRRRKFQWSKSYVATWTQHSRRSSWVDSFSDRNPTWPLER